MNPYRNDDPPDQDEDPTVDFVIGLIGLGHDKDFSRILFITKFLFDYPFAMLEPAFETAWKTANDYLTETEPTIDDGPFDDDPSGYNPDNYFQINPERRDE